MSNQALQPLVNAIINLNLDCTHHLECIQQVSPLIHTWCQDTSWIKPEYYQCQLKEEAHQIYAGDDGELMLCVFVWGKGGYSPIHNHLTWSVVGVAYGKEINITYNRQDSATTPGHATLAHRDEVEVGSGEIFTMMPDCIHRVENSHDDVSISLHVYGKDLKKTGRSEFDLNDHTEKPFRLRFVD